MEVGFAENLFYRVSKNQIRLGLYNNKLNSRGVTVIMKIATIIVILINYCITGALNDSLTLTHLLSMRPFSTP